MCDAASADLPKEKTSFQSKVWPHQLHIGKDDLMDMPRMNQTSIFAYQEDDAGNIKCYSQDEKTSSQAALQDMQFLLDKFIADFKNFDNSLRMRKEVVETDKATVEALTTAWVSVLRACQAAIITDDDLTNILDLLKAKKVVVFEGPAFNGLEVKGESSLLKVHLFPPDADETLWHNHGQAFFGKIIGKRGRYWHRQGEVHMQERRVPALTKALMSCISQCGMLPCIPSQELAGSKPDTIYVFEKQAEGDPKFTEDIPGRLNVGLAHTHMKGSMYFIAAETKHTVKAERGSGPVLTVVVQGLKKTNSTLIFKTTREPIEGNFAPRRKSLPAAAQMGILKAIMHELAEEDITDRVDKLREMLLTVEIINTSFALPSDQIQEEFSASQRRWACAYGDAFRHHAFRVLTTNPDINTRNSIAIPENIFKDILYFMDWCFGDKQYNKDYELQLEVHQSTHRDEVPMLTKTTFKNETMDDLCRRMGSARMRGSVIGEWVVECAERYAGLQQPVFAMTCLPLGRRIKIIGSSRVVPNILPNKVVKIRSCFIHDEQVEKKLNVLLKDHPDTHPADNTAKYFLADLQYSNADRLLLMMRNSKQEIVKVGLLGRDDLYSMMNEHAREVHQHSLALIASMLDFISVEVLPELADGETAKLRICLPKGGCKPIVKVCSSGEK
eukprot:TRINITY_DN23044_c0_g1_i1.p1 TRINITY_DN23044_c0_g1~~TRINITY_DN23044_c0_g1_i1.p1  ORF type:complete len:686 (+),score=123.57 TRINITY_DN23044_c0_g1_i1:49-2058(+)